MCSSQRVLRHRLRSPPNVRECVAEGCNVASSAMARWGVDSVTGRVGLGVAQCMGAEVRLVSGVCGAGTATV